MYGALACRTRRIQTIPASWAKAEPGFKRCGALWTGCNARLPQYEIQHDAERVRDEDCKQRPGDAAHSAAASVAVHISNQQDVTRQDRCSQNSHGHHRREGHGRLAGKSGVSDGCNGGQVRQARKEENPGRNNVELIRKVRRSCDSRRKSRQYSGFY